MSSGQKNAQLTFCGYPMKTTKYVLAIGFALLYLMLPSALRADTIFTYVGNAYNPAQCFGVYTCTGTAPFLSNTFDTTLTGAQLSNLSAMDISATLVSFSMSDGTLTVTQANASFSSFIISTDSSGNITSWGIEAYFNPTPQTFNGLASCTFPLNQPACGFFTRDRSFIGAGGMRLAVSQVVAVERRRCLWGCGVSRPQPRCQSQVA